MAVPGWCRVGRSGYTLVEMLFVVLIMALLGSVTYPALGTFTASTDLRNAATIVAADLRLAQSLASRQNRPVRVEIDAAPAELRLIDRSSGAVLSRRRMGSGSGVPVGSVQASVPTVDIFPNRMASGPLTVSLAAGDHQARVELTTAGFIRVVRP